MPDCFDVSIRFHPGCLWKKSTMLAARGRRRSLQFNAAARDLIYPRDAKNAASRSRYYKYVLSRVPAYYFNALSPRSRPPWNRKHARSLARSALALAISARRSSTNWMHLVVSRLAFSGAIAINSRVTARCVRRSMPFVR